MFSVNGFLKFMSTGLYFRSSCRWLLTGIILFSLFLHLELIYQGEEQKCVSQKFFLWVKKKHKSSSKNKTRHIQTSECDAVGVCFLPVFFMLALTWAKWVQKIMSPKMNGKHIPLFHKLQRFASNIRQQKSSWRQRTGQRGCHRSSIIWKWKQHSTFVILSRYSAQ